MDVNICWSYIFTSFVVHLDCKQSILQIKVYSKQTLPVNHRKALTLSFCFLHCFKFNIANILFSTVKILPIAVFVKIIIIIIFFRNPNLHLQYAPKCHSIRKLMQCPTCKLHFEECRFSQ